jgi:protein tyrosine phosphatase
MAEQIYNELAARNLVPKWFPQFKTSTEFAKYSNKIMQKINQLEQYRTSGPDRLYYTYNIAQEPKNKRLNRYVDILPFDHSLVELHNPPGYINASHLSSIGNFNQYIATQGPLPGTLFQFWQLVWEYEITVILMLTAETENGRIKCHRYWPKNKSVEFHEFNGVKISVKCVNEEFVLGNSTVKRTLIARKDKDERIIIQIQFMEWPDHKAVCAKVILDLISFVEEHSSGKPLLVHCSAGVGRTGTFCTIQSVLNYMKNVSKEVLPIEKTKWKDYELETLPALDFICFTINQFRNQRAVCVQSSSQLNLCYEAILLGILEMSKIY